MISSELKARIEAFAARLDSDSEVLQLARAGALSPETVARYLVSIRHLIRFTMVHLRTARDRARLLGNPELARYFDQKLAEESGHDRWADSDLDQIRARFGVTTDCPPAQAIKDLADYLSALVASDPESYLAYILFAEYFTVVLGPTWIHALETGCGIPASAMTVIGHHVELDVQHVREGGAEIDDLVRDPASTARLHATLDEATRRFEDFALELANANRTWRTSPRTASSASS